MQVYILFLCKIKNAFVLKEFLFDLAESGVLVNQAAWKIIFV